MQSWYGPKIHTAGVQVPSVTSASTAAALISSLYLFPHLTQLDVSFDRPDFKITQGVLCSIAELRGLRACRLMGGMFPVNTGLNFEVRGETGTRLV